MELNNPYSGAEKCLTENALYFPAETLEKKKTAYI